jgi:RNA polymerase sigma-70 factor (ECF subfamily)
MVYNAKPRVRRDKKQDRCLPGWGSSETPSRFEMGKAISVDQRDIDKVYQEYYPKILAYLKRIVGESEAEDAAQEVFVRIGRSLDGFRGESRLSTWIYRIATNAAMDHLRKSSSRQVLQQTHGPSNDEDLLHGEPTGPEEGALLLDTIVIREDMKACIRAVVDGLPEDYRTVLVLSEFEGLANAEIAEVIGISLDAVKIRLHRARTKLRNALEAKCNFYRDERNELSCDRKTTPVKFPPK